VTKRDVSDSERLEHFREQIGFLQNSADAFDSGNESKAKRLALTLRILLH